MANCYRLPENTFRGRDFVYGWLRFDSQRDSHQTCILQELDGLLRMTVPYVIGESEVSGWFESYARNDGDKQDAGSLPDSLWIEEVETGKAFSLVAPRVTGIAMRSDSPTAYGTITPGLVVACGEPGDYRRVLKAQSCSPELFRWVGRPSVMLELLLDEESGEGRPDVSFNTSSFDIPCLPFRAFISVVTEIKSGFPWKGDPLNMKPRAFFQTNYDEPIDLAEALNHHESLKKLMDIIYWDDIGFDCVQLLPGNADMDNDLVGMSCPGDVVLDRRIDPSSPFGRPPSFFGFADIRSAGIGKWFSLCERYARAIKMIDSAAKGRDSQTFESLILMLCTAMEEIADAKCKLEGTQKEPYKFGEKLRVIVDAFCREYPRMNMMLAEDVLNDIWQTYAAIKHTREERGGYPREYWITSENLHDVSEACRLLLYAWLSAELGCPEGKILECFRCDAHDFMKRRWPFFDVAIESSAF